MSLLSQAGSQKRQIKGGLSMAQEKNKKNLNGHRFSNLEKRGVSRRDFLKFCTAMTATLGLPIGMADVIAAAVSSSKRPPVIWLHFQECTGCTESLLRATHPTVEHLVLDLISLDYSETLSVAAGHQVEDALHKSMEENAGKYILVVEGSIPTKDNGIYCQIGGRTALEIVKEVGEKAAAIVAIGSCASWGGVQSSDPNPTGAEGVHKILTDKTVINIPGCPASPYNLLSVVLYYLTLNKLPELDAMGRPKFAYGRLIHENCERRPHFDAGRFANEFGDEGHRLGYCLYKLGCKGPETHANCPVQLYGDVGANAWPVGTGHPCFGCTEKGVGFTKPVHQQAAVFTVTPPATFPDIVEEKTTGGLTIGGAAVAGAIAGAAVTAGIKISKKLGKEESTDKKE
jgi:hydrogenase small subunit